MLLPFLKPSLMNCIGAFLILSSLSSALAQEKAGKKYAVLVGVERYQHSNLDQLDYAVDDVTDLAAILKQSGYEVTLLTDDTGKTTKSLAPTRKNIEDRIQSTLRQCKRDDTIMLAFAGHGLQFTGQKDAFFCPADARPFADETQSLVSISKVYSELEKSFAGVKVILIDACRNDPDPGRGRGGLDADAAPRPPRGVGALFSCSAGQRAFEHDELKHGVFFHYVLEGLKKEARDREGEVTFDGLALYVRKNVPNRVRKLFPDQKYDQFPNLKADLIGVPPVLVGIQRDQITNSIGMEFVKVEGGESYKAWDSGKVKIDSLYVGKYEVTIGQFKQFVKETGFETVAVLAAKKQLSKHQKRIQSVYQFPFAKEISLDYLKNQEKEFHALNKKRNSMNVHRKQTNDYPVTNITYSDMMEFCKWLSKKEKIKYQLPTSDEIEWIAFGDLKESPRAPLPANQTGAYSGYSPLRGSRVKAFSYEWSDRAKPVRIGERGYSSTSVGLGKADRNDIYDLFGNVDELTQPTGGDMPCIYLGRQGGGCPVAERPSDYGFRVIRKVQE